MNHFLGGWKEIGKSPPLSQRENNLICMIQLTFFFLITTRMMDPIVLCYGKGQLTGFLVDPNGVLDVVSDIIIRLFHIKSIKEANKS